MSTPTLFPRDTDLSYYTFNQVKTFHILELTASVLSVIVGTLAIVLWFRMDPSRRVIFRLELLLCLILSDYFKALFILCFAAYNLNKLNELNRQVTSDFNNGNTDDGHVDPYITQERYCDGWGFLKDSATICADLTIMTLTGHNALMIFKPSLSKVHEKTPTNFTRKLKKIWNFINQTGKFRDIFTKNKKNAIIVNEGGVYPLRWYIALVILLISTIFSGLIFVNDGHYEYDFSCSAPQRPVWKRLLAGWIIRYINLISIVTVYSIIIIYLQIYSKDIEKNKKLLLQPKNNSENHHDNIHNVKTTLQKELMDITNETNSKRKSTVKRELKSFAIYPIGYCFIWITPTISQIYNYCNTKDPFVLLVFVAFMIPLSCTIDTIIFIVREKPWNATSRKLKQINKTNHNLYNLQNIESQPLGIQQDPELQPYNPDQDNTDGFQRQRQYSWASSYLSNIKTLIGSKRPSEALSFPLPFIQKDSQKEGDGENEQNRHETNFSSTSDETAVNNMNGNGENGDESDGIDMIDFLNGRY